jgi:hypothetical protein
VPRKYKSPIPKLHKATCSQAALLFLERRTHSTELKEMLSARAQGMASVHVSRAPSCERTCSMQLQLQRRYLPHKHLSQHRPRLIRTSKCRLLDLMHHERFKARFSCIESEVCIIDGSKGFNLCRTLRRALASYKKSNGYFNGSATTGTHPVGHSATHEHSNWVDEASVYYYSHAETLHLQLCAGRLKVKKTVPMKSYAFTHVVLSLFCCIACMSTSCTR